MSDTAAHPRAESDPTAAPRARHPWRGLVLRLHFYAGVLVGPFLLVAALTGTAYALTPQLESWLYHDELTATSTAPPLPLADQVRAAEQAAPEGTFHAVRPAPEAGETTRVLFTDPGLGDSEWHTVFVDPGDASVTGELTTYGTSGVLPLRMTLDQLHRNLLLGEPGRMYSELAASWLAVIALGGLALWAVRRRSRARTGRARTAGRHGRLGVWVLAGALVLSATGLTWSAHAGANVTELRAALGWSTPELDASGGGHAGHGPHGEHAGGPGGHAEHGRASGHGVGGDAGPADPSAVDDVLRIARTAGIDATKIEITPPAEADGAWSVTEIDRGWPTQVDAVAVDPVLDRVTDEVRFSDYPLAAKLARWGIDAHMGSLFGWPNQVALAALGIGLAVLTVLGYRLWWLRGARGAFGTPVPRGQWRRLPRWTVVAAAAVVVGIGWFVPLLGVSLVAFLAVDAVVGRFRRRRAAAPDEPGTTADRHG